MKTEERDAAYSGSRALAGGGKKDKPKQPEHDGKTHGMEIKRGKNKGYTVHHTYKHKETGAPMRDDEPHIMGGLQELQDHIAEHMPEEMAEQGGGGQGEPQGD